MLKAKRLIALVLTLAMVLTMAGFSQMTASAKVKSVKAKKKVTVQVGKKKTVKIKIKTTGKTSKAFTVKIPKKKKKFVKVKKKKGKIIITGRKKGTVKITVRSKANKKKKKVIKVTVKPADAKLTVKQANYKVLSFAFSKKVNLKDSNITIQSKVYASGSYKNTHRISSFSTGDNKNYSVAVGDSFPYSGKIKVTVKGVNKKAIVKEIDANAPSYAIKDKVHITGRVGDDCSSSYDLEEYASKGYGKVKSFTGLPAGISYYVKDGYLRLKGTFSTVGVTTAKAIIEDEVGNQSTVEFVFIVGSSNQIVTYAERSIIYATTDDGGFGTSGSVEIFTAGGSGNYYYNIISKDDVFYNNISGYNGWRFNYIENPGTYSGQYEVVDDYDSNIRATGTAVIEARQARLIKGKATSATGKALYKAYVYPSQKSYIEGDVPYNGCDTDEKGEYKFYVADGKYDFYAELNDQEAWVLNRTISSSAVINFKLNLYEVILSASGVDMTNAEYIQDDDLGYLGSGNKFYLPKGAHRIKGYVYTDDGYKKVEASFTVNGDMTVNATIK